MARPKERDKVANTKKQQREEWAASAPFRAAVKGWAFMDHSKLPAIVARAEPLACTEACFATLAHIKSYISKETN
jgi:hypothetical protein